jgi:phosphosulfolactate synthase (CoM biosynthesis protein A)
MALLTAYGASKVYESGVPGSILKAVGQGTSNYIDKVRYIWPGQTLQKEGTERLVSGLVKGEANAERVRNN